MSDKEKLASLDGKLQVIRDRVTGVAWGYANGLYLWGDGGTSKSYTVEETLKKLKKPYKLSNSRLTGKGLYELLRDYPDLVHVLEDVETLFSDKNAFNVLRSALWGPVDENGVQVRVAGWKVAGRAEESIFTGGIIMVSNCPLDDSPESHALGTRINPLHYQPTNEEVAALMRKIASQGHRHADDWLSPEDCQEVAEEIVSRFQRLSRNLDLRLLVNSFQDRLQWSNGLSKTHWRDLLASRMQGRVVSPTSGRQARSAVKVHELAVIRSTAHLHWKDRLKVFMEKTGKGQATMFRRLQEVNKESSQRTWSE